MTIALTTPVSWLRGCGPKKRAALKQLGITTVNDLLHHYPTSYTFVPQPREDGLMRPGCVETHIGYVSAVEWDTRVSKFVAHITGGVTVTWFHGGHLRQSIFKGSRIMVSGMYRQGGLTNPVFKILSPSDVPNIADLNTVTYPCTSRITSKDISRFVGQVLAENYTSTPVGLLRVHLPGTQQQVDEARAWLKYDELFYMQLALAMSRERRQTEQTNVSCVSPPQRIEDYFPFIFTKEQRIAVGEIHHDMCREQSMNRLLQGDVGCGKTTVAAYAAILMAMNKGQTVILCPTEMLAQQHYEVFKKYFDRAGLKCRLVTSDSIASPPLCAVWLYGERMKEDVYISTTAILSEQVAWEKLGLVIIDEQHKFGVAQRAALSEHGNPHVLSMTATPIPRTIAMTAFGDLDVSTIKEMPAGRLPVKTHWVDNQDTKNAMTLVLTDELAAGHQVYVVCPRIEALDDEMRAVEEVHTEYWNMFPKTAVGYLHGKRTPYEKASVAKAWIEGIYGILVSTTVVEVGVDNPNATVMIVEGADRFGLAQLHQLRGRVGRGEHQSYCFLLSDSDSAEAKSRLRIMEKTNDGFEIAEHDLRMRGPGDLLSTRQHGLPDLKIADLVKDYDILTAARKDAQALVAADPLLKRHEHMRNELTRRLGTCVELGGVA